jgi:hypothetical protein
VNTIELQFPRRGDSWQQRGEWRDQKQGPALFTATIGQREDLVVDGEARVRERLDELS